jgi:hypothetical protein
VTEVSCDVGLLKDLFRLLDSAGAAANREFRFADCPLFAFPFLKSSSGMASELDVLYKKVFCAGQFGELQFEQITDLDVGETFARSS